MTHDNTIALAFSGHLAVGKTVAAQALVDHLGFTKIAFADELKAVSRDLFIWIALQNEGDSVGESFWGGNPNIVQRFLDNFNRKDHPIGRAWLQFLGERMRGVDARIWVDAALKKSFAYSRVVIDDLRYLSEAETLRGWNFKLVRIDIEPEVWVARVKKLYPNYTEKELRHPSETDLDDLEAWDMKFDGGLPLEVFQKEVVEWAVAQFGLEHELVSSNG